MNELNTERDAMATYTGVSRDEYQVEIQAVTDYMETTIEEQRQRVQGEIDVTVEFMPDHNKALENFVFDMANIQINTSQYGTTYGHGNGYQPYAKWITERLTNTISKFGEAMLDTFDANAMGSMDSAMAILESEKAGLLADNTNAQMQLEALLNELLDKFILTRESTELALTDW